MKFENWSIINIRTRRIATLNEIITEPCQLEGNVYGHSSIKDGDYIKTSQITKIQKGVATTKSGSKYILGKPLGDYDNYIFIKNATDAFKEIKELKL